MLLTIQKPAATAHMEQIIFAYLINLFISIRIFNNCVHFAVSIYIEFYAISIVF